MDTHIIYYIVSSYLINLAVLPLHCLVMFCMDKEYDLHTCPELLLTCWLFSPLCLLLEIAVPIIKIVFNLLDNIFKTISMLLTHFLGESKHETEVGWRCISRDHYHEIMFGKSTQYTTKKENSFNVK